MLMFSINAIYKAYTAFHRLWWCCSCETVVLDVGVVWFNSNTAQQVGTPHSLLQRHLVQINIDAVMCDIV